MCDGYLLYSCCCCRVLTVSRKVVSKSTPKRRPWPRAPSQSDENAPGPSPEPVQAKCPGPLLDCVPDSGPRFGRILTYSTARTRASRRRESAALLESLEEQERHRLEQLEQDSLAHDAEVEEDETTGRPLNIITMASCQPDDCPITDSPLGFWPAREAACKMNTEE